MFSKLAIRGAIARTFLSISVSTLVLVAQPSVAGAGHNHGESHHKHDHEVSAPKKQTHEHGNHSSDEHSGESHSDDGHLHEGEKGHGEHDDHEESVSISDRQLHLNNIKIERAEPRVLEQSRDLFGLVQPVQDKVFRIFANYESLVIEIHVYEGQTVKQGQPVVTLKNKQNLQTYTLRSPADGIVTQRLTNVGDHADENPLLEISDYSEVWVELTAFLTDLRHLKHGQKVRISTLTNSERHEANKKRTQAFGKITYIAQAMTASHIGKARVTLRNKNGIWRPGMHVQASVISSKPKVAVSVKKTAVQTVEGATVVFVKEGNTFEPKPVTLGKQDDAFIEVTSGLAVDTEYVSENSFVLKADLLKSGAAHSH